MLIDIDIAATQYIVFDITSFHHFSSFLECFEVEFMSGHILQLAQADNMHHPCTAESQLLQRLVSQQHPHVKNTPEQEF